MSDERHVQIQLRRGTAEEWANSLPQPGGEILAAGEPGFEKDTGRLKIGDGVKGWNELPYNTSSIVVEDIDKVVSEILVPGSGIAFNFNDSANSLTISQNPVQTFANNSVLTSDGSSTGIIAEPNLLFDGIRMTIKCSCPTGSSGLTMVGDGRSTQLRSNVYSDNYELETEDGIISLRNTSRMIFFGSRGTEATPTPLQIGDELFIIRGDAYNPHGTLNANGILDSRTSRISSSITATGTHYLGSSIFLKTSTGGPTLWDNTLAFDHTGVLSINSVAVSLDGHSHKSSDISDFNDAVTALVGESGGLTIESIQDNIANSFLVAGSNISLNYNDEADTLTISSTGGGGSLLPFSDNVVVCSTADNLALKYIAAKALTPNGNALSATNRATLVIMPGNYSLSEELVIDAEFVDILGLGSMKLDPGCVAAVTLVNNTINVTANNVRVKGIGVGNQIFRIGSDLSSQIIEDCIGGIYSFGNQAVYSTQVVSGTFINCIAGGYSFGSGCTASGSFINCAGEDYSFGGSGGSGGTASGTFKNCTGGEASFGGGIPGTCSGTLEYCTGNQGSFASNSGGTLSGTLLYCRLAGSLPFPTPSGSGKIRLCIDGDYNVVNADAPPSP